MKVRFTVHEVFLSASRFYYLSNIKAFIHTAFLTVVHFSCDVTSYLNCSNTIQSLAYPPVWVDQWCQFYLVGTTNSVRLIALSRLETIPSDFMF